MWRKLIAGILSLSLCLLAPQTFAAAASADKKDKANQVSTAGPRRHLTTIVFSGLAGAILGLSTLSFYGRPQDKLGNIAVGFAVGIFVGTIYTTYKAATEPHDFYSARNAESQLWADLEASRYQMGAPQAPRANFVFQF